MRLRGAASAVLALVTACSSPELPTPILQGTVTHVRDGDTLVVAGTPVRLQGIAAPELDSKAGRRAGDALTALTLHRQLSCQPDGTRSYDRIVAVCRLDGRDIGEIMVGRGLARDCPRYSGGRYAEAEAQAKAAGINLARRYRLPGYCAA
ncbi:MAG: thermonuclease family protein [Geminicoccaceae bacterium]